MDAGQQDLAGSVAMVTGSSSGIGRAIALELAAAGADLVLHTRRNVDAVEQVAGEVRDLGRQATIIEADLANSAVLPSVVHQAWQAYDRLDIWINNAGGDVLTGDAAEWPFEKKLEYLWNVDVRGTIGLSRIAGSRMQAERSGERDPAILNMGWDQADVGMGGDSGELFGTIKGAVMAFSRSLAISLAPQVRVNCLAPGWIKTAWGRGASADWQKRAESESLLGRWGQPDDVAAAARFLVSPSARFITGQIIHVNGGFRRPSP